MSEYLNQYPWLKGSSQYVGEDNDGFDLLDCLPDGWVKAFGKLLCEDLDREIKRAGLEKEFQLLDMKEKYGTIRIYCSPTTPAIRNIIRTYERISESVCSCCGTIEDVRMVTFGWVSPYCKQCFKNVEHGQHLDKFDKLKIEKLPTVVQWSQFDNNGANQHFEIDISETVSRIKQCWESRVARDEINACRKEYEE
jgi:hypothetical protein